MATQELKLTGPVEWARVFEDNRDMRGATTPEGVPYNPDIGTVMQGQYTINVRLDDENFQKLVESGSKTPEYAKESEDGLKVCKFKRPHRKFNRGGELLEWASGAPTVVNEMDQPWDFEEDGPIGNESECELTVAVYKAGGFYGTRLEKVKVLTYVKPEEKDDEVPF